MCVHPAGFICQDLVTEGIWQVTAVLEVKRVFSEKIITYKDGHGTQDERSEQVGVDVVAGTVQFPM